MPAAGCVLPLERQAGERESKGQGIFSMASQYPFRRQATRWGKLVTALFTLALFYVLAAGAIAAYLLLGILSPPASVEQPQVSQLLGNPAEFEFTAGGRTHTGWFYPGRRNSPVVVLCHGYRSHRAQLLTLASVHQENGFSVFLFDFTGHGSQSGWTRFGYGEAAELRGAIGALATRDDIDATRFGVWGTNLGAYAALKVAADEPRIRALVVDSVYERPGAMLEMEMDRTGLSGLPLVRRLARLGFRLHNWSYRGAPVLADRLGELDELPKLFFRPLDDLALGDSTLAMFASVPEPREMEVASRAGYVGMLDADKRTYETRVATFFLQHLGP
jgi:uncharacterized protein